MKIVALPCESGCSNLSYSVYADYLYWQVARSPGVNTIFAVNPSEILFLQPTYHSGYRVGGIIARDCIDLHVRYTSINSTTTVNNPRGTTGTRQIVYTNNFQDVDIAFGYTRYLLCSRAYLRPYLGAKLAWISDHAVTRRSTNSNDDQKLKLNAYGPMVGLEGSWGLFKCCFPISLIARGDLSILHGVFSTPLYISGNSLIIVDDITNLIAVSNLYIGIGTNFCCFSHIIANIQIGYETQVWNPYSTFLGTIVDYGLSGLVAHFSLRY